MKTILSIFHISITDITLILRDKSLIFMVFAPFLILLVLRAFVPFITDEVPVLADYHSLIVAITTIVSSIFPGFIMAFIILDEKEQHLSDVFRVLPWSFPKLLVVRIGLAAVTGFVYSLLLLFFSGLISYSLQQVIFSSVLNSFNGPVMALLVLIFSRNKIEGVVFAKGLNFILMIPLASFFIKDSLRFFLGVIPDFWSFEILFSQSNHHVLFMPGFVINLMILYILFSVYKKKMIKI